MKRRRRRDKKALNISLEEYEAGSLSHWTERAKKEDVTRGER